MNGNILLDANFVVALFNEESEAQAALLAAERACVPSVVLGELYYGARKSGRPEENMARVDRFAAASEVLLPDVDSARLYGVLRETLRRKGRPIPDNDIWIAAIARQHGLTLVTRDAHFSAIDELTVTGW
ncbi:type II toxin-antitoxin system VapC family toxin [candidate division WOR-3 bacterium]|nr:type II toxin-antitoxin system VapC family toxin [candidate division WOR-3 bacterium]